MLMESYRGFLKKHLKTYKSQNFPKFGERQIYKDFSNPKQSKYQQMPLRIAVKLTKVKDKNL